MILKKKKTKNSFTPTRFSRYNNLICFCLRKKITENRNKHVLEPSFSELRQILCF